MDILDTFVVSSKARVVLISSGNAKKSFDPPETEAFRRFATSAACIINRSINHPINQSVYEKLNRTRTSWSGVQFIITLSLITTSNRLERRFFLLELVCLRKYFCAWLATWVGVRVVTNNLEIPLQSPFPRSSSPLRNFRCSSSVHGTPANREMMSCCWWDLNNLRLGEIQIF